MSYFLVTGMSRQLLNIIYIAESYKRVAGVVYIAVVVAVVMQLFSVLSAAGNSGNKVSAMPVPGTYAPSPEPRTMVAALASMPTSGTMGWPVHGPVTTEFGSSGYPYSHGHTGIDITSRKPVGTAPVTAFRAGQVIPATSKVGGFGTTVAIDHGGGLTSYYGHLSRVTVQPGQIVQAGETIGIEGSTGRSTGPHVHFEIRVNDRAVNPRNYLGGNP